MPMSKADAPGAKPKQEDVQSDVDAAVVAGTSEDVRNHEPLVEDLSPGQYAEAKVGVNEGEPGTEEAREHGERFQAAKMEQRLGANADEHGKPADKIGKK